MTIDASCDGIPDVTGYNVTPLQWTGDVSMYNLLRIIALDMISNHVFMSNFSLSATNLPR